MTKSNKKKSNEMILDHVKKRDEVRVHQEKDNE